MIWDKCFIFFHCGKSIGFQSLVLILLRRLNYDVNFSKSNVELDSCKIYFIESEESRFVIKNCKNRAFFNKTN